MDEAERNRQLDRVKAKIFVGNNAAFLGPLMASLNFYWRDDIPTCATDYVSIFWNPDDFDKLSFDERVASLCHELAHNYRLHGLRQGERDGKLWNIAGDIVINRDLRKSGYAANPPNFLPDMFPKTELEEDIYELLKSKAPPPTPCAPNGSGGPPPPPGQSGQGGQVPTQSPCSCHVLGPITKTQAQTAIQNVVQAAQQAKMSGHPGDIPGNVETLLNTFLKPQIPWEQHLNQWFNEFLESHYSYRRPNRRYQPQGILMRSRFPDNGRLDHLAYYFDVSGSVSDEMVIRFNSEMKFIKDTYQPRKMTLVLFDTKIQKIIEFTDDDDFKELKVVGRGGTHLREVRQHIMDSKVTAAVVFSDLECEEMHPGPEIPIIWVCIDNPGATVPFGKLFHIKVNS